MRKKYVYSFGGCHADNYDFLQTVERLDLVKKDKWDLVTLGDGNPWKAKYEVFAVSISLNEMIMFGGYMNHGTTNSQDDCRNTNDAFKIRLESDEKTLTFADIGKLGKVAAFFWTTAPVFSNKCVYAVDYHKNLHVYDMKSDTWEISPITSEKK